MMFKKNEIKCLENMFAKPNNTELGSSTVKNIKCGKPRKQTLGFKLSNHDYIILQAISALSWKAIVLEFITEIFLISNFLDFV